MYTELVSEDNLQAATISVITLNSRSKNYASTYMPCWLHAYIGGTTSSASCTHNSENNVTSKVVEPINGKFHQNQPTVEEGIHMNFRRRLAQLYIDDPIDMNLRRR
jgi:hypothetical protein